MMKSLRRAAAIAAVAACFSAPGLSAAADPPVAAGSAQLVLRLVSPERFADAGYSRRQPGPDELEVLRLALQQALQPLVQRSLQPGDVLTLELLDLDLAGELQPTAGGRDLRVLRGATWPRMQLRYSLLRDGAVQAQAEQQLSDLAYLDRRTAFTKFSSDTGRYGFEQALLRDWYLRTLGSARPAL